MPCRLRASSSPSPTAPLHLLRGLSKSLRRFLTDLCFLPAEIEKVDRSRVEMVQVSVAFLAAYYGDRPSLTALLTHCPDLSVLGVNERFCKFANIPS
jgi:hypothetical protein